MINAAELEIRLLKGCKSRHGMLGIVVTEKACFGTQEGVENQLDAVDL